MPSESQLPTLPLPKCDLSVPADQVVVVPVRLFMLLVQCYLQRNQTVPEPQDTVDPEMAARARAYAASLNADWADTIEPPVSIPQRDEPSEEQA